MCLSKREKEAATRRSNRMPIYTFNLRDGEDGAEDLTGVTLADREQAYRYANEVAQELMKGWELRARFWRLDVYEDDEAIFDIPFASIDPTLDHMQAELRTGLEAIYDRQRSLKEAIHEARKTVRESRALVAQSRGKPYLATDGGRSTIRNGRSSGHL
jgi:hypothetical protein